MPKVTRGLAVDLLDFHKTLCALQSIASAAENEPPAEAVHVPHGTIIMSKIKLDDSFTKGCFGTFQNMVQVHQILRMPRENDLQKHRSNWPATAKKVTLALRMKKFRMSCTCHVLDFRKAPDVAGLLHKMIKAQKTSTALHGDLLKQAKQDAMRLTRKLCSENSEETCRRPKRVP